MSDENDPAGVERLLETYYVSRREYDLTHRNVETRLGNLDKRVDGHSTALASIDRVMNKLEAEQYEINKRMDILIEDNKVAKNERYDLLLVCQGLQHEVQNFIRDVSPVLVRRVTWAGGILVVLGAVGLLKDIILPVLMRVLGL